MFDDDLSSAYSKKNPKAKAKKSAKKKVAPVISKRVNSVKPNTTPKNTPAKAVKASPKADKKPMQIQDIARQYSSQNTTVIHVSGDYYWTIVKDDAERLTDHEIYCYFYKRFGLRAHEIEIKRPKVS